MAETNSLKEVPKRDIEPVATYESLQEEGISKELAGTRVLPPLLRDLSEEGLDQMKRQLVRKLDMRLMAPLILMYIMNYLDR